MTNVDILWIHDYIVRQYGNRENPSDQYGFYLLRVLPLLENYKCTLKSLNKVQFVYKTESQENVQEKEESLHYLITSYLQILQLYFQEEYLKNEWDLIRYGISGKSVDLKKSISNKYLSFSEENETPMYRSNQNPKCKICHEDYKQFYIHENHRVCPCGYVSNAIHSTHSYKDIDRINIASKYMYDRRIHFRDCINQFQGKQNVNIDPSIYKQLKQQLYLHDIIPENYEELSKEEAFVNVTKEHISLFLKEIKQTKHYEDIVLIHHELTGKPTPDISHLESQLLNDFDILVETYDRLYKHSERKNFINTHYVLFQFLRRHKYPCKKEDFNMLKTIDRKLFHDVVCGELFAELGWTFLSIF